MNQTGLTVIHLTGEVDRGMQWRWKSAARKVQMPLQAERNHYRRGWRKKWSRGNKNDDSCSWWQVRSQKTLWVNFVSFITLVYLKSWFIHKYTGPRLSSSSFFELERLLTHPAMMGWLPCGLLRRFTSTLDSFAYDLYLFLMNMVNFAVWPYTKCASIVRDEGWYKQGMFFFLLDACFICFNYTFKESI